MERKKVYLSYKYDDNRHYKNLILAWDISDNFEFIPGNAELFEQNAGNVSQVNKLVEERIRKASVFLVIIGQNTHESDFVRWEIRKAIELNIPIVAVKTQKENKAPEELYEIGVVWVMSFNFKLITTAINKI